MRVIMMVTLLILLVLCTHPHHRKLLFSRFLIPKPIAIHKTMHRTSRVLMPDVQLNRHSLGTPGSRIVYVIYKLKATIQHVSLSACDWGFIISSHSYFKPLSSRHREDLDDFGLVKSQSEDLKASSSAEKLLPVHLHRLDHHDSEKAPP